MFCHFIDFHEFANAFIGCPYRWGFPVALLNVASCSVFVSSSYPDSPDETIGPAPPHRQAIFCRWFPSSEQGQLENLLYSFLGCSCFSLGVFYTIIGLSSGVHLQTTWRQQTRGGGGHKVNVLNTIQHVSIKVV